MLFGCASIGWPAGSFAGINCLDSKPDRGLLARFISLFSDDDPGGDRAADFFTYGIVCDSS